MLSTRPVVLTAQSWALELAVELVDADVEAELLDALDAAAEVEAAVAEVAAEVAEVAAAVAEVEAAAAAFVAVTLDVPIEDWICEDVPVFLKKLLSAIVTSSSCYKMIGNQ